MGLATAMNLAGFLAEMEPMIIFKAGMGEWWSRKKGLCLIEENLHLGKCDTGRY